MGDTAFIRIENAAHAGAFGINAIPEPTESQCIAGNYKVGRVSLYGLPLVIEQPRGSYRTGVNAKTGKRWACRMAAHYGYIGGTKGNDGDAVDCFIGFYPQSEAVFVINQNVGGRFDEHKAMLAFPDEDSARRAYQDSYERGWNGLASLVPLSISQLKWWLKNGDMCRPLRADDLPYEGLETMTRKVQWNSDALPCDISLDHVLYEIRCADADDGLLMDAVTAVEIAEDSDSALTFDALVSPYARLERKMELLRGVMERTGDKVKPVAMQITEPFKQRGVAQVAVIFELSDGQTVTIFFHNPDVTPNKMAPTDEVISWKWLLNKKDITIVVAPERGADLNVREVARRIVRLAEKNSAAFARANANRAARMSGIQALKEEIAGLETELTAVQHDLEVANVEAEDAQNRKIIEAASNEAFSAAVEAARKVFADGGSEASANRAATDVLIDKMARAVKAAKEAPIASVANGMTPIETGEFPLGRTDRDESDEFHGRRVTVDPGMGPTWTGTVGMSLKHGALLEVKKDGGLLPIRVRGEQVVSVESAPASAASDDFDPTTPENYAKVMADPGLQASWQDRLDAFFQERIVAVRNALRALGWEGRKPNDARLYKGDAEMQPTFTHVGAGRNVAGWAMNGISDDLTKTPEEYAAQVNAEEITGVKSRAKASQQKPDMTYHNSSDGLFTSFFPNTSEGEKAWNIINATPGAEGGKVLAAHAESTIAQLRAAGYTVAESDSPAMSGDEEDALLNELGVGSEVSAAAQTEKPLIDAYVRSFGESAALIDAAVAEVNWAPVTAMAGLPGKKGITDDTSSQDEIGKLVAASNAGEEIIKKARGDLEKAGILTHDERLNGVPDTPEHRAWTQATEAARFAVKEIQALAKKLRIAKGTAEVAALTAETPLAEMAVSVFHKHGIETGSMTPLIVEAIEAKDANRVWETLRNLDNKASAEIFERAAGVKLGATQRERRRQIDEWAGITPEKRAEMESAMGAVQNEKARERKVKDAWDALKAMNVRNNSTGITSDGQQYLLGQVADGYDKVGSFKRGAATVYGLEKGSDMVFVNNRTFSNFLKAAAVFGGLRQALELVGALQAEPVRLWAQESQRDLDPAGGAQVIEAWDTAKADALLAAVTAVDPNKPAVPMARDFIADHLQGRIVKTIKGDCIINSDSRGELALAADRYGKIKIRCIPRVPEILINGKAGELDPLNKARRDQITGFYPFSHTVSFNDGVSADVLLKVGARDSGLPLVYTLDAKLSTLDSAQNESASIIRYSAGNANAHSVSGSAYGVPAVSRSCRGDAAMSMGSGKSTVAILDASTADVNDDLNIQILAVWDRDGNELDPETLEPLKPVVADDAAAKIAAVDASYGFESATDAFKIWLSESVEKAEYSPFVTAKAMDEAAKRHGSVVEWGEFGGGGVTLDSADEDEADDAPNESDIGGTFESELVTVSDDGDEFDADAEWNDVPEVDEDETALDGDFPGHPFRGNQHRTASRQSGAAVSSSIRAKRAEKSGEEREAKRAHKAAYHAHAAAADSGATGASRRYHRTMARFHAKRAGVKAALDSVALDSVNTESLYYAAKKADDEFHKELVRVYGKGRAGTERYRSDKFTDPKLIAAHKQFIAATEALRKEWDSNRRKLDSATLDGVDKDGYVGKIRKGGAVIGRIDIGDDGKAMVFVGESGDERVKFASGTEAMYSDDDAPLMVDALFSVKEDRPTPVVELTGKEPGDPPQKDTDRALFQSVIDGTVADILAPELAEQLEAAFNRNVADPDMVLLFEQAVAAYQNAMLTATANLA